MSHRLYPRPPRAPFAATQTRKVARIGLLDYTPAWEPFRQGLRELGYREGENLHLEARPRGGASACPRWHLPVEQPLQFELVINLKTG
jgi:hypothetical protein